MYALEAGAPGAYSSAALARFELREHSDGTREPLEATLRRVIREELRTA